MESRGRGYQVPTAKGQRPRHAQLPRRHIPRPTTDPLDGPPMRAILGGGSWKWGVPWYLALGPWKFDFALEVVPDPEVELALAELLAAAGGREDQVFPLLVERRAPDVVDVQGEPEQEALQADAVGGAAVLAPEAGDGQGIAEDRQDGRAIRSQLESE